MINMDIYSQMKYGTKLWFPECTNTKIYVFFVIYIFYNI